MRLGTLLLALMLVPVSLAPTAAACAEAGHAFSLSAAATVDEGAGALTFSVLRTGSANCESSVDYRVGGGSAAAGVDHAEAAGTLTFAFGVATRSVTVAIHDDATPEGDETVEIRLANPTGAGASLGEPSILVVVILDDDGVPALLLDPAQADFGAHLVGTLSAERTFTLTNNGDGRARGLRISTPVEYPRTTTCGESLAAGANCTISVRFSPLVAGVYPGVLTASATGGASARAELRGTGLVPGASLSVGELDFGAQAVGTRTTLSATLRNPGSGPLAIESIEATGDFAVAHDCGTLVLPAGTCTLDVSFAPTSMGARTGTLTVESNAPGDPRRISLKGDGIDASAAPRLDLARADGGSLDVLDLGRLQVGHETSLRIDLRNDGGSPLAIRSLAIEGGAAFSRATNCPALLARGTSCWLVLEFAPSAAADWRGDLIVVTNVDGSPWRFPVRGESYDPARPPALRLEVEGGGDELRWNGVRVGGEGEARVVTLTNVGGDRLALTDVRVTNDVFPHESTCGGSLAPSASCRVEVAFAPKAAAEARGTLVVQASDAAEARLVRLVGVGVALPAPRLVVAHVSGGAAASSDRVDWDPVVKGESSTRSLRLSNQGDAPLSLSLATTGAAFAHATTCGGTLAPGASCTVDVTFAPATAGAQEGALVIGANDPAAPKSIALRGVALLAPGESVDTAGAPQPPTPEGGSASTPGPGALGAAVALLVGALGVRRRRGG